MSEIVSGNENISAQSAAAALPAESVADVTTNKAVEAPVKAVPENAEALCSVTNENDSNTELKYEKLSSPKVDEKKTPVKRTPSKRMSFIERAQRESEELVKNMGGSLEIEGGRKTRSSTRGTPTRSVAASTPPPIKKARTSPTSGASTPTGQRGRGRKIDVADDVTEEEETKVMPNKTPAKGKKLAVEDVAEDEEVKEKSNEVTDVVEEQLEENEPADSTADKTDAALESIVEETQSQVAEGVLPTITKILNTKTTPVEIADEAGRSDSSKEIEHGNPIENAIEKMEANSEGDTAVVVEVLQKVKEPTPEPMEVDSSPKSEDALERMEDDAIEISDETESIIENQKSEVETILGNVVESNNLAEVECVKEKSSIDCIVTAPPTGIVANNLLAKPTVSDNANENESNLEEATQSTNEINKTENDLSEPKIAISPAKSAAANDNSNNPITTQQTGN